jgi:hypothetical protein
MFRWDAGNVLRLIVTVARVGSRQRTKPNGVHLLQCQHENAKSRVSSGSIGKAVDKADADLNDAVSTRHSLPSFEIEDAMQTVSSRSLSESPTSCLNSS